MDYQPPLQERSTEDLEKAIADFEYMINRGSVYAGMAYEMREQFRSELIRRRQPKIKLTDEMFKP